MTEVQAGQRVRVGRKVYTVTRSTYRNRWDEPICDVRADGRDDYAVTMAQVTLAPNRRHAHN